MSDKVMKAAFYAQHGPPSEVIEVKDVPVPMITTPDGVRVQVYAAGMNPVNFKLVEGRLGLLSPSLPSIDGLDISGVVVKVGPACKRLKEGDKVWGKAPLGGGSFAEFAVLSENLLVVKPEEITFEEAAGLGVVALTGYQGLLAVGNLQKGQKILILAGSGGTGSFAIQLAKHVVGAYVATTCSERNIEFVKGLGADEVINYREQSWGDVLEGQNYDFIYDCVGGGWEDAKRVLNPSTGHFLTITGDKPDTPKYTAGVYLSIGLAIAGRKFGALFGGPKYDFIGPKSTLEQYQNLNKWLTEGKIKCITDKVYPLEQIHEAYEYQHSGRAVGKIIVAIHPSSASS